jgi:hypothetical protein
MIAIFPRHYIPLYLITFCTDEEVWERVFPPNKNHYYKYYFVTALNMITPTVFKNAFLWVRIWIKKSKNCWYLE